MRLMLVPILVRAYRQGRLVAAGWLARLLAELRRILMRRRLITRSSRSQDRQTSRPKQPGGQAADADDGASDPGRSGAHVLRASFVPAAEDECGKVSRSSTVAEVRSDSLAGRRCQAWRSL
jgi:uncharacterized protein (DUF2235 family)